LGRSRRQCESDQTKRHQLNPGTLNKSVSQLAHCSYFPPAVWGCIDHHGGDSLDGRKLRDAIAATKNFPAVTGDITINENRDAVKSAVVVEMAGDPPTPKYTATVKPK